MQPAGLCLAFGIMDKLKAQVQGVFWEMPRWGRSHTSARTIKTFHRCAHKRPPSLITGILMIAKAWTRFAAAIFNHKGHCRHHIHQCKWDCRGQWVCPESAAPIVLCCVVNIESPLPPRWIIPKSVALSRKGCRDPNPGGCAVSHAFLVLDTCYNPARERRASSHSTSQPNGLLALIHNPLSQLAQAIWWTSLSSGLALGQSADSTGSVHQYKHQIHPAMVDDVHKSRQIIEVLFWSLHWWLARCVVGYHHHPVWWCFGCYPTQDIDPVSSIWRTVS